MSRTTQDVIPIIIMIHAVVYLEWLFFAVPVTQIQCRMPLQRLIVMIVAYFIG